MSALQSAVMVNIQSHTRTVLEFPEVGIVRFHGNNSHGKSVLVKVLSDVVSNDIQHPSTRRSIIRRGHSYGELLMSRYDGTKLFIRIDLEAASTYAELTRADGQLTRRYLADKAIPLLVREFGWHYDSNHDISINIHQDTDSFLFVDTKKSLNFDLLNSVRTDPYAEASAESITNLLKTSKKQRDSISNALAVAQATYAALQCWDVAKEQEIRDECLYLAENLEALDMPPMPELKRVPKVSFLPLLPPMPPLRYPKVTPMFTESMPDILPMLRELKSIADGVCPLCNRGFFTEGGHHEISC